MNEPRPIASGASTSTKWGPLRWVIGLCLLASVSLLVFSYFPVYHVAKERDETDGAIDFLRKLRTFQTEHLQRYGRYLGRAEWTEWPEGDFPRREGVPWGVPSHEPWASLPVPTTGRSLFKLRVRAGLRSEEAPKGSFHVPPSGPWYIIQARADLDGDQILWLIEITSAGPGIYQKNNGD